MIIKNLLFVCLCLTASILRSNAQTIDQAQLFKILEEKDNRLFNIGFNTCDISQFEQLVSNDFEFYHDESGTNPSKESFIADIKNGLCHGGGYQSRRELVKGSLQVFPLYNNKVLYGAIQTGKHRFYENEKGKPERFASIATFTHLWQIENGDWKLARVLSYAHETRDTPDS